MRIHAVMTGFILFAAMALAPPLHAEVILSVHPFKPPRQLMESFSPLAKYLSGKLGEPVSVRISRDYQTQIDALGKSEVDLAYLGPVSYVKLVEAYGARPLLARQAIRGNPVFHAKIFVRADSPIQSLADLAGKRFAFGEPRSTMSHIVPHYMLWQAGIETKQLASHKFVGDLVNVALGVLAGDFDAGAVKEDVFFEYEKRGLRAIATSLPISDHVFVASARMPEEKLRKVRELLLGLDKDARAPAILQALTRGVTALAPVADSDYDALRAVLRKTRELGVQY